jgi:hypothetical protein
LRSAKWVLLLLLMMMIQMRIFRMKVAALHVRTWDLCTPLCPCWLQVPVNKMDPNYQHPLIHIYLLKRRKQPLDGASAAEVPADQDVAQGASCGEASQATEGEQMAARQTAASEPAAAQQRTAAAEEAQLAAAGAVVKLQSPPTDAGQLAQAGSSDNDEGSCGGRECGDAGGGASRSALQFQTRREGSMLARQLRDVKL